MTADIFKTDLILIQIDIPDNEPYSFYSLGMLSIATVAKVSGFRVLCIGSKDLDAMKPQDRASYFTEKEPSIIGFNINSDNLANVKYIAQEIKKYLPKTTIIVGGPLVSILMEKTLQDDSFDIAVYGEGEVPVLELCQFIIQNKGSLSKIKGIIYKKNGKISTNSPAERIKDLDSLPPADYTLIKPAKGIMYSSGRGCPFSCSFCFKGPAGNTYRYFSAERTVQDIINACEKYNLKSVGIVDDTFTANVDRAKKICASLAEAKDKRNLDFILYCESRIDILYRHHELIKLLKEAGFMKIQTGIENGNQTVLDAYNKRITLEQIETVIEHIYEQKPLSVVSNIIFGGPFETEETAKNSEEFTIRLMNKAPGMFEAEACFLCPFPGTAISSNPEQYDLTIRDTEWLKGQTVLLPSCETKHLDMEKIIAARNRFTERTRKEMKKIAAKMPYTTFDFHKKLADYGFHTHYYKNIIEGIPIIKKYYDMRSAMPLFRINEIPESHLLHSRPELVAASKKPHRKGWVVNGGLEEVILNEDIEAKIFDCTAASFSAFKISEILAQDTSNSMDREECIRTKILPLWQKLEKNFYLLMRP